MPNMCQNFLRVVGNIVLVRRFQEISAGADLLLDIEKYKHFLSNVKAADRETAKVGVRSSNGIKRFRNEKWSEAVTKFLPSVEGYNYCLDEWWIKSWGKKWGVFDCKIQQSCEDPFSEEKILEVTYLFNTPWIPPVQIIKVMGEQFPDLEFELKYVEWSQSFNGIFAMKDGKISFDQCADTFW